LLHAKAFGKGVFDPVIIARHLQRQPLMMRSHCFGRNVPFNRQSVDIGMRYSVSALGELLHQRKEKRIRSEIVEEDFYNHMSVVFSIEILD
jgi:hypothetical protein